MNRATISLNILDIKFSGHSFGCSFSLHLSRMSFLDIVGSDRNGQNSLRIEDMGNYTCQVMSSASTDTVSKSVFLSIECK